MPNSQVFFIVSRQDTKCKAYLQYNLLRKKKPFFSGRKYFLIKDSIPDFDSIGLKNEGVILFGYKDVQYPIIETKKTPIGNSWFKTPRQVAVFFMSDGDRLLKDSSWEKVFRSWVTFKGKYQFLIHDSSILTNKIPGIYNKLFALLKKLESSGEIMKAIEGVYNEAIIEIFSDQVRTREANIDDMNMSIYKIRFNLKNLIHN